jgi:ribosomal protein L37AE/L43A
MTEHEHWKSVASQDSLAKLKLERCTETSTERISQYISPCLDCQKEVERVAAEVEMAAALEEARRCFGKLQGEAFGMVNKDRFSKSR